jgi:hypothetical protein
MGSSHDINSIGRGLLVAGLLSLLIWMLTVAIVSRWIG